MGLFKKYRLIIGFVIFLTVVYFLTRLFRLDSLPIFTDEAIYLRWAQIAKQDAAWRFISLTDGKQPLFIWLVMFSMHFIKDPILAGRFVSVIAGFFSMVGLFFLSRELFHNTKVGIFTSTLYLLYPMALVYDRMALYDSLVGTFAVWSLYCVVCLVRRVRLDIALISAIVMGGGVLTKTSGFFSLYLLPVSLLLFDFTKKDIVKRLIRWVVLAFCIGILTYAYYFILRLSPFFHIINEKNTIFVYPLTEWFSHPLEFFLGNFMGLWNWLHIYVTWPLLFFVIFSLFVQKKYTREKAFLLIWFLIPFFFLALFGKTIYPRFIFFMTLALLPLIAYSFVVIMQKIKNVALYVAIFFVAVSIAIYSDYVILTDFPHAPIPLSDRSQYSNDWPAGGGVKEAIQFFNMQAKKEKIYIGTEGTFGLLPAALELYLVENKNITIKGFWPVADVPPKDMQEASRKMSTYAVFYQPCVGCEGEHAPISWRVQLVSDFVKPNENRHLYIYKLQQ